MSNQNVPNKLQVPGSYEQLLSTLDPNNLSKMPEAEREALGMLFIKHGESLLNKGDSRGISSLENATKVAPSSPHVYFNQAIVYAAQGQNVRCLTAASQALEKATQLNSGYLPAWHSWGNILVRLGVLTETAGYFYQADEKFNRALTLYGSHGEAQVKSLFWHWGVCWYRIGFHSGEVVDLMRSLDKFREAEQRGCCGGEFHNDFGNLLVDLSGLLFREDLYIEAIGHYEKFVSEDPKKYEPWLNLACTNMRLYDLSGKQDYFKQAEESFEKAMTLNANDALLWMHWAHLHVTCGKVTRYLRYFESSLEKFEKAQFLDPDNPQILIKWGEALAVFASHTENLALLREAEKQITHAVELAPENPMAWHVFGNCLSEFGRYFSDDKYYLQAIEKYQKGLSLSANQTIFLHSMVLAYFAIGDITDDPLMLEKAISLCQRISEIETVLPGPFLNDWGVALMKLGELTDDKSHIEAAAEKFDLAIRRTDSVVNGEIDIDWVYNHGCAMDFLGEYHEEGVYYEKAIQLLTQVLQRDPDHIHARYHLALAFLHLGELNSDDDALYRAADIFQEVVKADPEDEVAWNDYGMALINIAFLIHDSLHPESSVHVFEQAESKFQKAISLGNKYSYYNLACLYALTNNIPAAIHYLERADQADALPSLSDVVHDEWLEGLLEEPLFRQFVSRLLDRSSDPEEEDDRQDLVF